MLNRRQLLASAAALAALRVRKLAAAPPPSPIGLCWYSYMDMPGAKQRTTLDFLDHAKALGAAGVQAPVTSKDPGYPDQIKARASELGLYYEGIVSLPKGDDVDTFEHQIAACKAAGAAMVRSACLSGRRYETFSDLAAWEEFAANSHKSIQKALPILNKHKVALALENHKDFTVEEFMKVLPHMSSEYMGLCLDFGNNLSLLDTPVEVMELAPYAISTHIKDIAVELAPDGFNMTEVPLGEGIVDVKAYVAAVRKARPDIHFNLEMITREPLSIPCLTDKYWVTFPERNGIHLARAMALVEKESARLQALPRIKGRTPMAVSELGEENIKDCLNYGREHLA